MSQPPGPDAADIGNPLLTIAPAQMNVTQVVGPDGVPRLAVTIRTATTTLTVFLTREDAGNWSALLAAKRGEMTRLVVARPGMTGNGAGQPGP